MKTILLTAAAALISIGATAAQAATITRTFTGTLTFAAGPVTATTFGFGFTYDPTETVVEKPVDYFTTSSNYPAFDPTGVLVSYVDVGFAITGGGEFGLSERKPDFSILINDNLTMPGSLPASYRAAFYTTGERFVVYRALSGTLIETTGLSAVPEPAAWAMMIAGIGAVGGTLRQRRRRPALVAA